MTDPFKKAYQKSMGYLARNEHARFDITQKLKRLQFESDVIDAVLDKLQSENLQSESRFTEHYIRMRSQRGYGPERIRQELNNREINENLIAQAFTEAEVDWLQLACDTRVKKFGSAWPSEYAEQCQQKRFLQYRGFDSEQIREACC